HLPHPGTDPRRLASLLGCRYQLARVVRSRIVARLGELVRPLHHVRPGTLCLPAICGDAVARRSQARMNNGTPAFQSRDSSASFDNGASNVQPTRQLPSTSRVECTTFAESLTASALPSTRTRMTSSIPTSSSRGKFKPTPVV